MGVIITAILGIESEIEKIDSEKVKDKMQDLEIEATKAPGSEEEGGDDMGGEEGGGMGDLFASDMRSGNLIDDLILYKSSICPKQMETMVSYGKTNVYIKGFFWRNKYYKRS